jgi:beta-galactosidase
MNFMKRFFFVALSCLLLSSVAVLAAPLTATIPTPPPAQTGYFDLGTAQNPGGHEISVNSRSLLLDGQPWFPVMGEFHYARVSPKANGTRNC